MIRLIHGLYVEDKARVDMLLEKMKDQVLFLGSINSIAEFMKDLSPTIKLYHIFTQSLKPIFTKSSLFHTSETISELCHAYRSIEKLSPASLTYNESL